MTTKPSIRAENVNNGEDTDMENVKDAQIADALKLLDAKLRNKSVSMAAHRIISEEIRKYDPDYPTQVGERRRR
jgi:hypothetical protein